MSRHFREWFLIAQKSSTHKGHRSETLLQIAPILHTGTDPLSIDARCLSLRALVTASAISNDTEVSCELNGLTNPQVGSCTRLTTISVPSFVCWKLLAQAAVICVRVFCDASRFTVSYEWNSRHLPISFIKIRFSCNQNIGETLFYIEWVSLQYFDNRRI